MASSGGGPERGAPPYGPARPSPPPALPGGGAWGRAARRGGARWGRRGPACRVPPVPGAPGGDLLVRAGGRPRGDRMVRGAPGHGLGRPARAAIGRGADPAGG